MPLLLFIYYQYGLCKSKNYIIVHLGVRYEERWIFQERMQLNLDLITDCKTISNNQAHLVECFLGLLPVFSQNGRMLKIAKTAGGI